MNKGRRENEMPKAPKLPNQSIVSATSQMAFAVAICALAAAGIGLIVNHWLTGWMAVGGMVGVGLFYTAIGILNLRANHPTFEDDAKLNISQRAAKVENLYGEAIARSRFNPLSPPDSAGRPRLRIDDDESKIADASGKPRHEGCSARTCAFEPLAPALWGEGIRGVAH